MPPTTSRDFQKAMTSTVAPRWEAKRTDETRMKDCACPPLAAKHCLFLFCPRDLAS
jgi:hypothetical protein